MDSLRTPNFTVDRRRFGKRVFRREGQYWSIGYGERVFCLKHTNGLAYIAYLLRHSGTEVHVLDLCESTEDSAGNRTDQIGSSGSLGANWDELEAAGIHVGRLGDAGEMLDEEAKAAYKARIAELRSELQDAKDLGNLDRATRAEDEIDSLMAELSRAVGLGGRDRRAASAAERARQRIKKAIQTAVKRIERIDPKLGEMLAHCIRTGTFCSYHPASEFSIEWEFTAAVDPTSVPGLLMQHTVSGDRAPAAADHPQESTATLGTTPFSSTGQTTFVGRDLEASAIRTVIDHALTAHRSLIVLWGGPGVSKTRVTMEMAEYASQRGFSILSWTPPREKRACPAPPLRGDH